MTPTARSLPIAIVVAALVTGCGGSNGSDAPSSTTDAVATSTRTSEATLKAAVRTALRANVRLSTYVLWHNQIPVWATQSTRGPALNALRASAATRRRQSIQIKNLSGHYTIISIALAPSYATAFAVIKSHQRVVPYKAGRRLGRAIVGDDHARIQLRRVGNTQRFIVWSVAPIR
jgi:hypothetical protein